MTKHIMIDMDEELYYKLVMLKARLRCRSWREFIEKVMYLVEGRYAGNKVKKGIEDTI